MLDIHCQCSQLRELKLYCCAFITDFSINEIALKCKELIKLDCSDCPRVTIDVLTSVVQQCPKLQMLMFTTDNLLERNKFLKMVQTSYPNVKIAEDIS